MSSTLTALTEAGNAAASDLLYVVQGGNSRKATGINKLLTYGTITANNPLTLTQTWNNSGVTFTALKIDVTPTALNAASKIFDIVYNAASFFSFSGDSGTNVARLTWGGQGGTYPAEMVCGGFLIHASGFAGGNNYYLLYNEARIIGSIPLSWSPTSAQNSSDVSIVRDEAGVLGIRNPNTYTTPQKLRVYSTFTDSSNYERGALNAGADYIELAAETAGSGDDDLDVRLTPAGTGRVRFGTHSAVAAETVTGYLTVKDSGGTSRKLAVIS